ncbi:MAG: hypothetical protein QXJ88_06050, partial [Nitrososphaerota archaeon]
METGSSIVKNVEELKTLFRDREEVAMDLVRIVGSALAAVEPRGLVRRKVSVRGDELHVGGESVVLSEFREVWIISV